MSVEESARAAIKLIDKQLKGLDATIRWSRASGDVRVGWERLNTWESRTAKLVAKNVSPEEGDKLKIPHLNDLTQELGGTEEEFSERQLLRNLTDQASKYEELLNTLKRELEGHPEEILKDC